MNALIATKETQGQRKNDFCWSIEGEPLMFTMECDGERVDGPCGCKRAFSGCISKKATTTAKIVEVDQYYKSQWQNHIKTHLIKNWSFDEEEAEAQAKIDIYELIKIADTFPANTIVEKRGCKIQERRK